jgi:hypothetical protein
MTLASTSNTMNGVKSEATCSVPIVCFLSAYYQTNCGTWRKSKSDGIDDAFRFKCPLSCSPLRTTTSKSAMGDSLNFDMSVESMDSIIPCATLLESLKNDHFVLYVLSH